MWAIVLLLQTSVFLAAATLFFRTKYAAFYHPFTVYLIFHFLVFVLRPWLEYFADFHLVWEYMQFQPTNDDRAYALAVSSVTLFVAGFTLNFMTKGIVNSQKTEFRVSSKLDRRILLILWVLLGPIAIYSMKSIINGFSESVAGHVEAEHLSNGATVFTNTTGYLIDAQNMLFGLGILTIVIMNFKPTSYIPLLAFVCARLFVGSGRWGAIIPLFSLAMLLLLRQGRKWPSTRVLIFAPLLLGLFTIIGEDRDVARKWLSGAVEQIVLNKHQTILERLDNLDFGNYEFLTYIVNVVPEKTGTFTFGAQYLQLFTEPVPRMLWPEKPIGEPIKMFDLNDYGNFIGLTPSMAGDAWMSGGWLGVIMIVFILCALYGRLFSLLIRRANISPYHSAALVIFVGLLIQAYRDGGVVSLAKFSLFSLLPIILGYNVRSSLIRLAPRRREIV
jgi:oligosaccharide repeat unit polymerase